VINLLGEALCAAISFALEYVSWRLSNTTLSEKKRRRGKRSKVKAGTKTDVTLEVFVSLCVLPDTIEQVPDTQTFFSSRKKEKKSGDNSDWPMMDTAPLLTVSLGPAPTIPPVTLLSPVPSARSANRVAPTASPVHTPVRLLEKSPQGASWYSAILYYNREGEQALSGKSTHGAFF
jgi:hypothetical protein